MTTTLRPARRRLFAVALGAVGLLTACQPEGSIDSATATPQGVQVSGWARDPDSPDPIDVHVYVDGAGAAVTRAAAPRPDVAAAKQTTPQHGFTVTAPARPGPHEVCVYGIDKVGGDGNALIGCRSVVVPSGNPFGVVDAVTEVSGNVQVRGWALDPSTSASIDVHVYVDGRGVAVTRTSIGRADVLALHPGLALASGFAVTIPKAGSTVCAYGINVGAGANDLIGCRTMPGALATIPAPTTATTTTASPTTTGTVTPGAFCTPSGAYGRTVTGLLMRCTTTATDNRNRWREA